MEARGSAADLAAGIVDIGGFLTANEASTGPYPHGGRFVAFLNVGGMEYDGGTTTSVGSLQHETFHSWWGRGLKPASQADGWWDEAWTVCAIGATSRSSVAAPWPRPCPWSSCSQRGAACLSPLGGRLAYQ